MLALMDHDLLLRTVVAELPLLRALYLFGSHARGDASPASDVDLGVLVAKPLEPVELVERGVNRSGDADFQVGNPDGLRGVASSGSAGRKGASVLRPVADLEVGVPGSWGPKP